MADGVNAAMEDTQAMCRHASVDLVGGETQAPKLRRADDPVLFVRQRRNATLAVTPV